MKVALVKSVDFVCDESSSGIPAIRKLPCQIFLAGSYSRSIGIEADVFNLGPFQKYPLEKYDMVVSWVPLYEGFYKGIGYLEEAKKDGKITVMVLNDPLETLEMEAMERFPYIDYCIRLYEREYSLGYLIKEIEKGNKDFFPDQSGIIYRIGARVVGTQKRPPLGDLQHLPSTADFLQKEHLESFREVFIETGRGCPFGCTFCFYNGTAQRKRDFKDIISELKSTGKRARHIWLHDLNMLANEKWTNALCDALIEAGVKAQWGTDARLDECANLELLKKMKRAGCYLLVFGVESADEEILEKINKKIDLKLLDKALENCRKAGIKPELNIMYGFPWDDENAMKKTWEFIKKYPVTCVMLVRPLRGTRLYDEYKRLGIMKKDMGLDDYILSKKYPAFPTLYLSRAQVYKWHRRFESLASKTSFLRKTKEEGIFYAAIDWVKLKGLKLLNPKKIIEHIFIS